MKSVARAAFLRLLRDGRERLSVFLETLSPYRVTRVLRSATLMPTHATLPRKGARP